jgi:hypothetical protein
MAVDNVPPNKQSIHRILSEAVDALVAEADSIRAVAQALADSSALTTSTDAEQLRTAASVVRSHALGMLLSVVQIAAKAERLATIADVRAVGAAS